MLRPALQKLLNPEPAVNSEGPELTAGFDRSSNSTPEMSTHSSGAATPELATKFNRREGDESQNWGEEKNVYEMQLTQLQEQLVETMLENQQLASEIKGLKESGVDTLKKEIEEERKKRKKLEEQVRRQKPKRPPRPSKKLHHQTTDEDSELDYDDLTKELEAMANSNAQTVPSAPDESDTAPLTDETTTNEVQNDVEDHVESTLSSRLLSLKIATWNFIHERISDFICDDDATQHEEEEEPLAVKRLRENVSRFTDGIQPIKAFLVSGRRLFSWKNPWMTLSAFLIYMYSVWLGLFIPLIFLLGILKLTSNFLYAKGISQKFGYHKKKEVKEDSKEENTSWSEKYQLVLQIARKVQNTLGEIADSLEKFESLFLWEHEEASKKLYTLLCLGFVFSLCLSTRVFFLIIGLSLGFKMFLITPIYNRFPKQRYDDIDRLWDELPTHSDLELQKSSDGVTNKQESQPKPGNDVNETSRPNSRADSIVDESSRPKPEMSWESIVFCDRFQLPSSEVPLTGWHEGRRCTLLNKENPLSSMKHGRLYLTKHFLCFERNQYHSKKNLAFHLQDIIHVLRAKPLSFLPGGGMAIEVKVKDYEKPFVFGAMMARDEAYDSIILAGKVLNMGWSKRT